MTDRQTLMGRMMGEISRVDEATFRLLTKFHNETPCGTFNGSDHWAECDALAHAFGYDGFEHWRAIRIAAMGDSQPIEDYLTEQRTRANRILRR